MCVHYWILDTSNKGICKKCGKSKDFSEPPIILTKQEKREIKAPFNDDFYKRGSICLAKLNVL